MASIQGLQYKLNKNEIENAINEVTVQSIQNILNNELLDYYANMTIEYKKQRLKTYANALKKTQEGFKQNQKSVNYYFDAYELILEIRQYILGRLGNINYTFSWSIKERGKSGNVIIKTVTLPSIKFIELLKDNHGNIIGLQDSNGNLRFSSAFLKNLKNQLQKLQEEGIDITVNQNYSSFSLVNEIIGTRQDFTSGKIFKAKIEALQKNQDKARWYTFIIEISKDISKKENANVLKFNIREVHNSPKSSSIFSAIGKYFADEMITKRNLAQRNNVDVDPSYPNAGNLTEMYISAKARLNNGHNTFKQRTPVPGEILFNIYNQIKANTEPFYSGGDYLMEQIKSFLGSNPSLTSFATIEKTVNSFYTALNTDNFNQMKQSLSELLLQKPGNINLMTKEQKEMSQAIASVFTQFFSDLT